MVDPPGTADFNIVRWTAEWRGRIAAAAAQGRGLDVFREALGATPEILESLKRTQAKMEVWDAAVRHLEEVVGFDTLAAIYTSVTSEMPPGTQYELDEAALHEDERRDGRTEVQRLANLMPLAYERERQDVADRLGCRVSVLDAQVRAARAADGGTKGQGRPLKLPEIVPWHEPVDGAELLDSIVTTVRRFVVLPHGAAEVVALWTVATHCFQQFDVFPRLTLRSATPQCGKTTLRDVVAALVAKPLRADSIMAAALFRTIEIERPTLLLDEAETYLSKNEELRGIINSGHRRDGQVIRCVGDDHEPRQFSTWAPILLAQIGNPPATVYDRSIVITLTRKRTLEHVELLSAEPRRELKELARKAVRWTSDSVAAIAQVSVPALQQLSDRANDNWRPLLAIAGAAGGTWPDRARTAAAQLTDAAGHDAASVGEMLVVDLHQIFCAEEQNAVAPLIGRLSSADLSNHLIGLEGRPWAEWKAGKPITPNGLARLLKPFKIYPATIRLENGSVLKGYRGSDFADVFERYGLSATVAPLQSNNDGGSGQIQTVTPAIGVTVEKPQKANSDGRCNGVTVDAPDVEDVLWTV